jgi:hypothetical protein
MHVCDFRKCGTYQPKIWIRCKSQYKTLKGHLLHKQDYPVPWILDLYIVQISRFKAFDLSLVRTCPLELFSLNSIMILQYPNSC